MAIASPNLAFELLVVAVITEHLPSRKARKPRTEFPEFSAPREQAEPWKNTPQNPAPSAGTPMQKTKPCKVRHRMALVFRSYLGSSSRWANAGVADRKLDFKVWCGPAMGSFNEWAQDSVLEPAKARSAPLVAANLMVGAAEITRALGLRQQGLAMATALIGLVRPRSWQDLEVSLT